MQLSDSYKATILAALAHEDTPQARETLLELERQGWNIPAWIRHDFSGWSVKV